MLGAAHNRARSCCIMRSFVKTVFPVHFSAREWPFFAGDNGYTDKMAKVSRSSFSVPARCESVPGRFSRVRYFSLARAQQL